MLARGFQCFLCLRNGINHSPEHGIHNSTVALIFGTSKRCGQSEVIFFHLIVLLLFYNLLYHWQLTESFNVQKMVNITFTSISTCSKLQKMFLFITTLLGWYAKIYPFSLKRKLPVSLTQSVLCLCFYRAQLRYVQ